MKQIKIEYADITDPVLELVLQASSGSLTVTIPLACKISGVAEKTWRNTASMVAKGEVDEGKLPFPATPAGCGTRRVSVFDIVNFIRPPSTKLATDPIPVPVTRGRGRPRKGAARQIGGG